MCEMLLICVYVKHVVLSDATAVKHVVLFDVTSVQTHHPLLINFQLSTCVTQPC